MLQRQTAVWGFLPSAEQFEHLMRYARLLEHYDLANVIGTREHHRIVADHIIDSLSCLLTDAVAGNHSLVDVGAGGGLPGIPLKIMLPSLEVSFIESTGKKARFLEHAIAELNLDKAQVLNGRAEEYGRSNKQTSKYDVATARALAPLPVLAEYCLPLLKVGGYMVAMKARLEEEELQAGHRAAAILGACIEDIVHVGHIPDIGSRERKLVVVRKVHPTPTEYPRQTGVPKSRPLGMQKV